MKNRKMDSDTNISLVALIVAWIALIIASLQLFQALFGTAEGYKRCAKSVIGHWERLRHRRFVLSELRFEVQYITPHIVLVTPGMKQWLDIDHARRFKRRDSHAQPQGEHVYLLQEQIIRDQYGKSHNKISRDFGTKWWDRHYFSWKGWLSQKYHPWESNNKLHVLYSTTCDPESAQEDEIQIRFLPARGRDHTLPVAFPHGVPPVSRWYFERAANDDDDYRVTWNKLLREICAVYSSYVQHSSYAKHPVSSDNRLRIPCTQTAGLCEVQKPEESNLDRTDAAITFRQWSWDIMPPEVTRPLATITVGHLVVLAVRLGMLWRVLNFETGMSADGHGFSLVGMKSDKLGYVFKLTALGYKPRPWRLIPNQATDKLICGILPGCPVLVRRDYAFIDNNRKSLLSLTRALEENHVLAQIGVPRPSRACIEQRVLKHAGCPSIHNEVSTLLCSFLPLPGSTAVRHYAHAWSEKRRGVFHFWEGRYALLYYLKNEVEQNQDLADKTGLNVTLKNLLRLEEEFPIDFFTIKEGKAIGEQSSQSSGTAPGGSRRAALIDLCREIHNDTTSRLNDMGFAGEDDQGRTHYENLVAAHLTMAIHATLTVCREKNESMLPACQLEGATVTEEIRPVIDSLYAHWASDASNTAPRPPWLVTRIIANVKQYVEDMRSGEHRIAQYMSVRGCRLDDSALTAAWWMLMLRGIAWDMSTIEHSWGEPVPASFYDNHVTVWIT